ncbi:MAG: hypothetical protein ACLTE2_05560 [Eubacteriales bacterium]
MRTNKFAGSTVLDVANRMASEYNAFALPELTLIDEHVLEAVQCIFKIIN